MDSNKPSNNNKSPIRIAPIKPIVSPEQVLADGGSVPNANTTVTQPANAPLGSAGFGISTSGTIEPKEYFQVSSPEFKAFWGQRISSLWFAPKKRFTLPHLILSLIAIFIFYLSSLLLFSPMELVRMITYQTSSVKIDEKRITDILGKYRNTAPVEKTAEEKPADKKEKQK